MIKKPVIICVDDEQIILNSISKQLIRKFGNRFEYEFAESAEEALEIIEELSADGYLIVMVISDQIMPGMTGDQFLVNVHNNHPKPIKILLTGQAAIDAAINAVNKADLYRYLTKPWDEDDFLLTVERGIQQYYLFDETVRQLEVFRKFVPREFLEFLGRDNILDVKLGDQIQQEMSIMFTDIRDFTSLSEKMTPKENFDFINAYLKRVGPVVRSNKGIIDKFIGDAVMALFPETSENAVIASINMHKAVMEYNKHREIDGFVPIRIGIGIHRGLLMLGTIGDDQRMQSTVIADAVNLASRIEGLTKYYSASTLMSEEAFKTIPTENLKNYNYRLLGKMIVKGKSKPVLIYDFYDSDTEELAALKKETSEDFQVGLELFYNQSFAEASVRFNEVAKKNPNDKAARLYLERSAKFMLSPVTEEWDAIDLLDYK